MSSSATISSTQLNPYSTNLESNQPDHQQTRSSLIVAATGLGKTVIMAGLARVWPTGRVMMISHRFEINQQALHQLSSICSEDVDLEQAGYIADQRRDPHRIVVASVQTLNSYKRREKRYRMERFDPNDFGLLLIDEAHRSAAVTYRRVVKHFMQNPELCVVGVTATPDRLDGVGMDNVFHSVACDLNVLWGVENGWLVAPRQLFAKVDGLDLREVRTVGGDLDNKQLQRIVELEENLHKMAKPIVDIAGTTDQGIVFTASVKQAHSIAEKIRDYHLREYGKDTTAVAIDGSLSPQDPKRRQIVDDFKAGKIQFLCNCGVATEGFDAPSVRLIAIGRPTKSRALYQQMLGRGLRPLPGVVDGAVTVSDRLEAIKGSDKPRCTVLDFVGQAGRHKLLCSTDFMTGKKEPEEVKERANRISGSGDFTGDQLEALREAREQLAAEREAARHKVTVGVKYELLDEGNLYDLSQLPKVPGYMQRWQMSDKQKKMMLNLGYTSAQINKVRSKRGASQAIDHAIKNPRTSFGIWLHKQKLKEESK